MGLQRSMFVWSVPITISRMKKIILALACMPMLAYAQEGSYEGLIKVNALDLEVKFELKNEGGWTGKMDIPMQNAKDLVINNIEIKEDSLLFQLPDVPGTGQVKSIMRNDSLIGTFHQMGQVFPFYASSGEGEASIKSKVMEFELLVDSLRREFMVPGVSIAMIYKGEVRMLTGFGHGDLEKTHQVDENTIYAIGSSSKAFTAAMTLQTVEETEGLNLQDPISSYIPGFSLYDPIASQQISAEDLLCHRSGLPRHDYLWYGSSLSRPELVSKLKYLEPTKPFRTDFQYQNLMFMSAGYFVGQQNKSTWEEELQKRIFDPLGMERSTASISGFEIENSSKGFTSLNGEYKELPYRNIDACGPAGSINSSVTDMSKWVMMLLNEGKHGEEQVISKAITRDVMKPRVIVADQTGIPRISEIMYGLGWMIYRYEGYKVVEHGGNIDGFSALVYMIPAQDFGLVILTNRNGTPLPNMLSMYATDIMLETDELDCYSLMYPNGFSDSSSHVKPDPVEDKSEQYYALEDRMLVYA